MADIQKEPVAVKQRGYKLAKGGAVELRGVTFKVTNDNLKDQRVIDIVKRVCPEAFEEGLIVPA